MSIEQALAELTAAITKNTAVLEQVLAGQGKALEVVAEGKSPTTRKSSTTKKADDKKADDKKAEVTTTASSNGIIGATEEQLMTVAKAWVGKAADEDEKKERSAFLAKIAAASGKYAEGENPYAAGPKSKLDDNDRGKAVFFIKRANKLGMDAVDLTADYDFSGKPEQEVSGSAEEAEGEAFDPLA